MLLEVSSEAGYLSRVPYAPKMLALPEGGGVALPFARIYLEDLSTMHRGPSKVLIYPQKVIICPQSVPFFPRIDHLTTFISLSKIIYALLSP